MKIKKFKLLVLTVVGLSLSSCEIAGYSITFGKKNKTNDTVQVDNKPDNNTNTPIIDDEGGGSTGGDIDDTFNYDTGYRGNYYDTLNVNSPTFKNDLKNLVLKNRCTTGYGSIWSYIQYSDAANPEGSDSKVLAYYRGTAENKSDMNKEHVWPNSHGGDKFEGDPHMVRPTLSSDNSSRGNEFYVEGRDGSRGWDPANFGVEQYRGDAARIIFYCALIDDRVSLVDTEYSATSNANKDNKMGKLSDLLKWNKAYQVSAREMQRNDVLNGKRKSHGKSFNFNRNPFIDHPEYAEIIWGTK